MVADPFRAPTERCSRSNEMAAAAVAAGPWLRPLLTAADMRQLIGPDGAMCRALAKAGLYSQGGLAYVLKETAKTNGERIAPIIGVMEPHKRAALLADWTQRVLSAVPAALTKSSEITAMRTAASAVPYDALVDYMREMYDASILGMHFFPSGIADGYAGPVGWSAAGSEILRVAHVWCEYETPAELKKNKIVYGRAVTALQLAEKMKTIVANVVSTSRDASASSRGGAGGPASPRTRARGRSASPAPPSAADASDSDADSDEDCDVAGGAASGGMAGGEQGAAELGDDDDEVDDEDDEDAPPSTSAKAAAAGDKVGVGGKRSRARAATKGQVSPSAASKQRVGCRVHDNPMPCADCASSLAMIQADLADAETRAPGSASKATGLRGAGASRGFRERDSGSDDSASESSVGRAGSKMSRASSASGGPGGATGGEAWKGKGAGGGGGAGSAFTASSFSPALAPPAAQRHQGQVTR